LGDIYLAWQDFPRAEKAFRHALAGNAFDSHAHFGLGGVLEVTSRQGEALDEYERGLAMDPSDAAAKAAANRLLAGASPQKGSQ
jgi:tetratricopeptide (TPR) repeat protein